MRKMADEEKSCGDELRRIRLCAGFVRVKTHARLVYGSLNLTKGLTQMRWLTLSQRWKRNFAARGVAEGHAAVADDTQVAPHLLLGRRGEELAAAFLERAGYRLVASNFKLPVGRNLRGALVQAEIDLIAYEQRTLCFIEVKTRVSDSFAPPEANVDLRKQRQITRAARVYRRTFGLMTAPYRYDVVSIIIPQQEKDEPPRAPRIELLRNFWTDDKFRKRRWPDN